MPLAGDRLSPRSLARLCHDAGWRDENLIDAVCVILQESAGFTEATHLNDNGSIDRGLWQINSVHGISEEVCFDPVASTAIARKLYTSRSYSFRAWAAYTSGAYVKHRDRATRGVANYWREEYGLDLLS